MKKNNQTAMKPEESKVQAQFVESLRYANHLEKMILVYGYFYMKHGVYNNTGNNEETMLSILSDVLVLMVRLQLTTDYIHTLLRMRYPWAMDDDFNKGIELAKKHIKQKNITIDPDSRITYVRMFISRNIPFIAEKFENKEFDNIDELFENDCYE